MDETLETIPQTDSKKQQRKTLDGRQVIIILLLESSQSKMEDINQGHTEPPSHTAVMCRPPSQDGPQWGEKPQVHISISVPSDTFRQRLI